MKKKSQNLQEIFCRRVRFTKKWLDQMRNDHIIDTTQHDKINSYPLRAAVIGSAEGVIYAANAIN